MKFLTSLTLILLVASTAFGQKESVTKNVTFKDAKNRFSITYPPDWQSIQSDEGSQFKLSKHFGIYGWYQSAIIVAITYIESERNTPRKKKIEDLETNLDRIEAAAVPSAKMVASGRTRLAGRDAFFTEMITTLDGGRPNEKFLFRTVSTWDSGYHYTVSLVAEEHTFRQAFTQFERIVSTFTID